MDLLGAAFFHLTRYEEVARPVTDGYGRFPAGESWAHRNGALCRPLVDEGTEVLAKLLAATWPRLERRRHSYSVYSTHDVDFPFASVFRSPLQVAEQTATLALRHNSPARALTSAREWFE